jgi:hypothetical protein
MYLAVVPKMMAITLTTVSMAQAPQKAVRIWHTDKY